MLTQNIQVLGERNPKDKLNNINLTRSVRLNDLTQEEMAELYRRGQTSLEAGSLNNGFNFNYYFQARNIFLGLDVVAITFDSVTQAVVFDCGYSAVYNRYFRVLLTKGTDGTYSWSQRITAPTWVDEDNIKTINGESLVGTGDIEIAAGVESLNGQTGSISLKTVNGNELIGTGNIEIKGGSDGNIITIRYGKDDRNIEAYKLLDGYTAANNAVSVNLQYGQWLYDTTNIWSSSSEKRIYFDMFMPGNLSAGNLSYSRFYLTEDGTCSMKSNTTIPIPSATTTPYVYFRLENSNSIMDWKDNLGECGIYMQDFLNSNQELTATLSCYCKVQENNTYQLVPFSIWMDENGYFHIHLTAYYWNEGRRYDITADSWANLQYSPTINHTTIN